MSTTTSERQRLSGSRVPELGTHGSEGARGGNAPVLLTESRLNCYHNRKGISLCIVILFTVFLCCPSYVFAMEAPEVLAETEGDIVDETGKTRNGISETELESMEFETVEVKDYETEAVEVEEEPGPDEEDLVLDGVLYDAALAYVGASVEELYDAIGEPESSQYASSCEQDNADDGMLFYDGFYVWTLRTADGETVRAVYLDE